MSNRDNKTVLITGASAGIGKAFAEKFASEGWDLVITARREKNLRELAKSLQSEFGTNVVVIPADMSNTDAPQYLYDSIISRGIHIDALVNNAGYGVPGYYVNTDWQQQKDFIQVLVTSVSHLCHLFLPGMIEQNYGRIINVSSINGLLPCSPGQSLYASAKSYVVSLSHTLQAEAGNKGVNVCALCPGLTYTEFHDVTGTRELVNKLPKNQWMDAESVASEAYDAVMKGDLVCITGRSSKVAALASKFLPRKMMVDMMKKQSGKIRKENA